MLQRSAHIFEQKIHIPIITQEQEKKISKEISFYKIILMPANLLFPYQRDWCPSRAGSWIPHRAAPADRAAWQATGQGRYGCRRRSGSKGRGPRFRTRAVDL